MMVYIQKTCLLGTVSTSSLDNSTLLTMGTSTQPTNWAARKRGSTPSYLQIIVFEKVQKLINFI